MKKCLLSCTFLLFLINVQAQIGLSVAPTSSFAPDWQVIVENFVTHEHTDFLEYGASGSLDYTIRLKNPSWRIQPAIHAMRSDINYVPHQFDVYSIGILANIGYTPFKKETRNKIGGKPVWIIQLSPGVSHVHSRYRQPILEGGSFIGRFEKFEGNSISCSIGVQMLLEWQLTELLSLSPLAGIRYFPRVTWDGFTGYFAGTELSNSFDTTSWRHLFFGLRIGLNLKEK